MSHIGSLHQISGIKEHKKKNLKLPATYDFSNLFGHWEWHLSVTWASIPTFDRFSIAAVTTGGDLKARPDGQCHIFSLPKFEGMEPEAMTH